MSEEYFRQVYRADPVNAGRQSESEYLDYALGRRGLAGETWKGLVAATLRGLSAAVSVAMNARLWKLANRALGEWAKDNAVRAFDETVLRRWAEQLEKARARDPGDGSRIASVLDEAEAQLTALIRKRGLPVL